MGEMQEMSGGRLKRWWVGLELKQESPLQRKPTILLVGGQPLSLTQVHRSSPDCLLSVSSQAAWKQKSSLH